jgi:AcrR family transcriptional regulator
MYAMRRPGGRTETNRAAVFAAVAELMRRRPGEPLVIAEVAERSGVHATTIYRRWKTPEALALDVAVAQLQERSPLPDTGSLRGDLLAFATTVATSIAKPTGQAFLRAVIAAPGEHGLLASRAAQIQAMLDRAASPRMLAIDVFDWILAPIYSRVMFGIPVPDKTRLALLVDRAIANARRPG